MKNAIRKRAREFAAIVGLILVSALVAGYILAHQRLTLPSWVPVFGQSFYTLKAEFQTAQAVTPGQGQTVDIAGVPVGQISNVDLVNGRAVVTMHIKPKYAAIYPDAHMLLRPKTGLKDMIVELDPGNVTAGDKLRSGATIPVANTLPDVNLDEVLSSLDADSRDYLQLLLNGGGAALRGNGPALAQTFRRLDPTTRDIERIAAAVATRRANLRRLIHNFQRVATAIGGRDRELASLVVSSNGVFAALASQDANLRAALAELPGALSATHSALVKTDAFATQLGPALGGLRPGARALGPALRASRPFLRDTTPVIRTSLRPFARAALPTVRDLRPAASNLAAATPNLTATFQVVNQLLNELAFEPQSGAQKNKGYLYWLAWANHNADTVFGTQDANGPIRRGALIVSCSTLGLLSTLSNPALNPVLATITRLLGTPPIASVCPSQAGANTGT